MLFRAGEEPFFGIESVPYLAAGYDEIAKLQEFSRPVYEEIAKKRNQKILYIVPWPGQAVHSKNPINAVADLRTEERPVGKRGVSTLSTWQFRQHYKTKTTNNQYT